MTRTRKLTAACGSTLDCRYKILDIAPGQAHVLAITRRHLHSMPSIRRLDESDNVRRGFFEEPELRRVVSYLPEYLQDFTLYGFLKGWRKGGIKNLRWLDVIKQIIEDKETNERMEVEVAFLPNRYWKNREPQTMPLVGELTEIIARRRRAARAVRMKDGVMLNSSSIATADPSGICGRLGRRDRAVTPVPTCGSARSFPTSSHDGPCGRFS